MRPTFFILLGVTISRANGDLFNDIVTSYFGTECSILTTENVENPFTNPVLFLDEIHNMDVVKLGLKCLVVFIPNIDKADLNYLKDFLENVGVGSKNLLTVANNDLEMMQVKENFKSIPTVTVSAHLSQAGKLAKRIKKAL